MPSEGPNSPDTVVTESTGAFVGDWVSPGNAVASDDSRTTVALSGSTVTTERLNSTDFDFAIPSGETIAGIVVEVEKSCTSTSGNPRDGEVRLIKGGVVGTGTNKATATVWPTTDAYLTYGSSTDLWGLTFTDTDINATNFGVSVSALKDSGESSTTVRVDHVRITVHYGAAGTAKLPAPVIVRQAVKRASFY